MPIKDFTKIPSPRENDLEEYLAREKLAEKDRAEKADFNDEERMLENDPSATQTSKGKRIMRQGNKRRDKEDFGYFRTMTDMMGGKDSPGILRTLAAAMVSTLGADFSKRAALPHELHKYEDERYIYDTTKVSAQTHRILTKEFGIVQAKIVEIEIARVKNPAREPELVLELKGLVSEFQMMQHPKTHRYIHSIERVEAEEAKWNPQLDPTLQIGLALIYRAKACTADARGIKSRVGDVYDQNPQEAIASGGHLDSAAKGPNPSP